MERIQEALKKARIARGDQAASSRQGSQARSGPNSRSGSSAASGQNKTIGQARSSSRQGLGHIDYTTTTVIDLDKALLEKNRVITHQKTDKRSAPFDILRTKVLQKMARTSAKTLAITSPTPENGKTVIAINLAYSIAQNAANSVLLVDFDLRRPSVGKYLGITHQPSLSDYLSGGAVLEETMVNPSTQRLTIIANASPVLSASETLASDRVIDLIAEVRARYSERTIIFDLPPLLGIDDSLVVLPHIDATLLVVGAGQNKTSQIEEAKRLLSDHNLIGVAFNKSNAKPIDYY